MGCHIRIINKISDKIGFTENESKIIIFLISALLIGIIIRFIKIESRNKDLLEFDYKSADSMFLTGANNGQLNDTAQKFIEKDVDSKRELLDFNGAKLKGNKLAESVLNGITVDINSAAAETLALLPGIGLKTAQNIIDYRKEKGAFKKIEDLLKVKGIGKSKFEKINKFIIVK